MNSPLVEVNLYHRRPAKFAPFHSSVFPNDCACEPCWTSRAIAADNAAKLAESRLVATREENERHRTWRAEQFAHFRTWATGMAQILRLPTLAWAVVEIVRLVFQ